jgi:hypothetical protein
LKYSVPTRELRRLHLPVPPPLVVMSPILGRRLPALLPTRLPGSGLRDLVEDGCTRWRDLADLERLSLKPASLSSSDSRSARRRWVTSAPGSSSTRMTMELRREELRPARPPTRTGFSILV